MVSSRFWVVDDGDVTVSGPFATRESAVVGFVRASAATSEPLRIVETPSAA